MSVDNAPPGEKCSDLRAVCNIVMAVVGLGILQLPGTVECYGLAGFACWVTVVALSQFFMTNLFYKAMILTPDGKGQYPNYVSVGEAAFGRAGKIAAAISVHSSLIGICACILILWRDTMNRMLPFPNLEEDHSKWIWAGIGVLLAQPFIWLRNMADVGLYSSMGVVAVFALAALAVVAGIVKMAKGEGNENVLYFNETSSAKDIGFRITLLVFSFGSVPVIPSIHRDMKNPQNFSKVLAVAYMVIFAISVTVAMIGYLGFGAKDLMVLLVPQSPKPIDGVGYAASVLALFIVLSHIVVLFSPVADASQEVMEHFLGKSEIIRKVGRGLPSLILLALGILVETLELMVLLVASVSVMFMCMFFPAIFYHRLLSLRGLDVKGKAGTWAISTVIFGLSAWGMVCGSWSAIEMLAK